MRTKPCVAEAAVVKNTNDELRATNSPNQNDKEPKNSDEHTARIYFRKMREKISYGRRTLEANI